MSIPNVCPCCSNPLLRHFGDRREYWFCRHCWSEMPNLETAEQPKHKQLPDIINLSTNLTKLERLALTS